MRSKFKTIILATSFFYSLSVTALSQSALACDNTNSANSINQDFIINDRTITHKISKLEFKRCLEGQTLSKNNCKGKAKSMSWLEAEAQANTHSFNAKEDWRLPKIEELQILLKLSCNKSTIDKTLFPSLTTEQIWSASPGAPVNDHSVVLNVSDGEIYGVGRGVKREVLLVRGKPSIEWLEQEPPSDWVSR